MIFISVNSVTQILQVTELTKLLLRKEIISPIHYPFY
jgi:hypothetical protein